MDNTHIVYGLEGWRFTEMYKRALPMYWVGMYPTRGGQRSIGKSWCGKSGMDGLGMGGRWKKWCGGLGRRATGAEGLDSSPTLYYSLLYLMQSYWFHI